MNYLEIQNSHLTYLSPHSLAALATGSSPAHSEDSGGASKENPIGLWELRCCEGLGAAGVQTGAPRRLAHSASLASAMGTTPDTRCCVC